MIQQAPSVLGPAVTGKKFVKVPRGTSIDLVCLVQADCMQPMMALFEPNSNAVPEGLQLVETMVKIPKGKSARIKVNCINVGNRDITVSGKTEIGRLQMVRSVFSLLNPFFEKIEGQNTPPNSEETFEQWDPLINLSYLDEEQQVIAKQMLREESRAFIWDDEDYGLCPGLSMKINLKDDVPVQKNYNGIPRPMYDEVKGYLQDLMERGWVQKSKSAYSSPIVCLRKKDGSLRLCVDYRTLNQKTIPDRQPLPRVQDILEGLGGKKWFSAFDQSKAYHQSFVDPVSRHLTAFITPLGLHEWVRIPYGLTNAPPYYQRFMEEILSEVIHKNCEVYLDDMLVYSQTFQEHVGHFRIVLQLLQQHGVKMKPAKCRLFQLEMKYLGHIMSADGYRADETEIAAMVELKESTPKRLVR